MLDQFSDTIDKLYAAAADRGRWQDALHSIEDLTGSVGAVIGFVPKTPGEVGFNLSGRFTAEQCATYSKDYQPICRRTHYMIEHPDLDLVYDGLILSEQEMSTDPVYDWFGQHDLRYFVGSGLAATQQHFVVWTLQRSPGQGHVQRSDMELFKLIKPHLSRTLALADQLGTLTSFDRFSSAVLDALPQALFALDRRGKVLFANAAATALVDAGDGLLDVGGRLQTTSNTEQALLDRLISEAAYVRSGSGDGWLRVSRSNGGLPYAVLVAPLSVSDEQLIAAGAKILVVVHDTASCRRASVEMLTSIYGLTDTEARIASALSGGHSVDSAAALLVMKPSTARFHLKAIFRKLGVGRQQDLVRLLTSLSMLSPPTV